MARLREIDRRILLGDNFEQIEAQEEAASREPVTIEEKRKVLTDRRNKADEQRFSSLSVLLTGAIMAWGAWHRAHRFNITGAVGYFAVALGLGWFIWQIVRSRTLQRQIGELPKA